MAKRSKAASDPSTILDADDAIAHPRNTHVLFGQSAVEEMFLKGYRSGALAHAWLLTGEKGIGKATFAYRAARFLLSRDARSGDGAAALTLELPPTHATSRQISNRAHPSLFVLESDPAKTTAAIAVDDVRKLRGFLGLTSVGAWRAVIVDAANDLTPSSANALLKGLEEPPPRTVFFLIAHGAAAVMQTIRSRCVRVTCATLNPADLKSALIHACERAATPEPDPAAMVKLCEKAHGSPGRAMAFHTGGLLAMSEKIALIFARLPKLDRSAVLDLVRQSTGPRGANGFPALCDLIEEEIEARARLGGDNGGWASLWETFRTRRADLETLNLDKGAFLIGAFSDIEQVARASSSVGPA